MRILLIHQYYQEKNDPGGMRWNEITRIWAEQGHEITVIAGMTHYTKGLKDKKYKKKFFFTDDFDVNIKVIRTHVSEKYNKSYSGRAWAYISFIFSSLYAGLFKARGKYDIMIVSSPPLSVAIPAYLISLFRRIPFVFEIRDLWPESAIETGILKNKLVIRLSYSLERFIYRKAKLINVLTPAMRLKLIEEKSVPENKIIQISNAADFRLAEEVMQHFDREAFRRKLGWDNKLVVIYVGAHGIANHLQQIIETGELLRSSPVLFVLLGDGMQKKMLMQRVAEKGLTNINFIDSVSKAEALQYIMAADIGTSVLKKAETFKTVYSNKTFDYMSCRKPILMAIDGISRELLEKAGAGIFVEPENPSDFAEKINYYVQNPALIKQHGENGYNFAKTHFDRLTLANQYLKHLELIVGKFKKSLRTETA